MKLSTLIGSIVLALAGALAMAHALGQSDAPVAAIKQTGQEKLDQRETVRRAAVAEHQKRKDDFARRCIKRVLSDTELEACRAAYRQL